MSTSIEDGLLKRQQEIDELQKDISRLTEDQNKLKPTVEEYEKKGQLKNELKKTLREKKKQMLVVVSFFKDTSDHYLTKVYPMFKEAPEAIAGEPVAEKESAA